MARKNVIWSVAVLTVIAVFGTPTAQADFRVRVEQVGGSGAVITDNNGTGDLLSGTAGTILYAVGNAGFSASGTAIQQPPAPGLTLGQIAGLDLNALTLSVGSAQMIRLSVQATGFSGGNLGETLIAAFAVGGTATGINSITFQSYANNANAVPAYGADQALGAIGASGAIPVGPTTSTGGAVVFGSGAFSNQLSPQAFSFLKGATDFSLFLEILIDFSGAGTVSFNAHTTVTVPEPATIAAALTGLPVIGGFLLRRRKVNSAIAV